MKKFVITLLLALLAFLSFSQIYDPVDWSFSVEQNGKEATLVYTATIEEGWHVYSQILESDEGPVATEIEFLANSNYELVGKTTESKTYKEFDPNFDMNLTFFKTKVVLKQKIKLKTDKPFSIEGSIYFMVCNESMCLPPSTFENKFELNNPNGVKLTGVEGKNSEEIAPDLVVENIEAIVTSEHEAINSSNQGSGIEDPIDWEITSKKIGNNLFEITAKAKLDKHWHIYANRQVSDLIIPTEFYIADSMGAMVGTTKEIGDIHEVYEDVNEADSRYYENEVTFVQQFSTVENLKSFTAEIMYMLCDTSHCLAPTYEEIEVDVTTGNIIENKNTSADNSKAMGILPAMLNFDLDNPLADCGGESTNSEEKKGLWLLFLLGIGGGLFAILTPCVYPMIPLTVSFFTKGGQDAKGGFGKAALYGFFIFLIYTSLSLPFWFTDADPQVLNGIATNPILNLIFFAVFVFFAFSFLGYYELTLPSKWSNKVDSASNVGGIIGIALMALTLALVSFSCTGPILGSVLAGVLKDGPLPLTVALAGFGLALGLPFALFAAFPSLMKKMPQSGGWLNSVKVVLGFLELALAIKFLSNADLVMQWGLIKREVFFALWILIGLGLVAYLFGLIKFPHDSKGKLKLKFPRVAFALMILAFVIYLIPGLTCGENSNRRLVSGFPPPIHYSYCGGEMFHAYKDYEEGRKAAIAEGKPMLVDFTGWACVNCREVEENIWPRDEVMKLISEEYILVSLYVDAQEELPLEEQGEVDIKYDNGKVKKKKIRTVGDKWFTFETLVFKNNAQPRYALLSPDGKLLNNPISYDDIQRSDKEGHVFYADFLKCGLEAYKTIK
jgi:thiol:disulfide interchange protein